MLLETVELNCSGDSDLDAYVTLVILAGGAIAPPVTLKQRCAVGRCARPLLLCHKVAPSVPGSSAPQFSGGQGSWGLVVPPAFGYETYAE